MTTTGIKTHLMSGQISIALHVRKTKTRREKNPMFPNSKAMITPMIQGLRSS
jgi:hypothetical protein